MGRAHSIVAERAEDQHRESVQASAQVTEQVERGLIRPVQVLQYEQRRRRAERGPNGGEQPGARIEQPVQVGPVADDRVQERAEWRRGGWAVRSAAQHTHAVHASRELAGDRRLADPCLATHEQEAPASAAGLDEVGVQGSEHTLAFQQHPIIETSPPGKDHLPQPAAEQDAGEHTATAATPRLQPAARQASTPTGCPCSRARIELMTGVAGWFSAKPRSQDGNVCVGTNALLG